MNINKVIRLTNDTASEFPSLIVSGGYLQVVGNLKHGDRFKLADKGSMLVLLNYLEKESLRKTDK